MKHLCLFLLYSLTIQTVNAQQLKWVNSFYPKDSVLLKTVEHQYIKEYNRLLYYYEITETFERVLIIPELKNIEKIIKIKRRKGQKATVRLLSTKYTQQLNNLQQTFSESLMYCIDTTYTQCCDSPMYLLIIKNKSGQLIYQSEFNLVQKEKLCHQIVNLLEVIIRKEE